MGIQRKIFFKKSPGLKLCFGEILLNVYNFIMHCQTEVVLLFWSLWHSYYPDSFYTGFWMVSNITFLKFNPSNIYIIWFSYKWKWRIRCIICHLFMARFLFLSIAVQRQRERVEGSQKSNTTNYFHNHQNPKYFIMLLLLPGIHFSSTHFPITDGFITWQIFLWPPSTKTLPWLFSVVC